VLFASTSLAARIERAEARLVFDCASAAARRRSGVLVVELAGGVASFAGPSSPFNKIVGLGFEAFAEAELEAVERELLARAPSVQVELSCLGDPAVAKLLTRRGYQLVNFENVLARPLAPGTPVRVAEPLAVAECPATDAELWLDVVVAGFAAPDQQGVPSHESYPREALREAIADLAQASGFVRYLARRAGAPAGAASMRLFAGVAQLAGAATLPEHRRRGVQAALLATRLEAARLAGCELAVVTTQPGSKSQENVQKHGFELLYTRAILVKEGAGPDDGLRPLSAARPPG
jgi:GNAT superfamily N-acetyltransferase